MSAPKRIQRKRVKGWTMPEGAVYVGRPGKWGNPVSLTVIRDNIECVDEDEVRGTAVLWYRADVADDPAFIAEAQAELRGHDLACWCPLDQPCHADVLLELANR